MFLAVTAMQEHRSFHVYEMMTRLGIEPNGSILPRLSLRYATAFHRCEACPFKQACRDWLDHAPALVSLAPHFCPDADILFELQFDQPGLSFASASKRFP
jgi:hypothetical protein